MPTTSPDSIYYADGTTPASLADITSAMATSVQNALDLREGHTFAWANATEKSAQTGMVTGDIGYQADNATFYIYSGSSWKIWAKAPASYSPTFSGFTASASSFTYSIAGGVMRITGKATLSSVVTATMTISTPTGYNIDITSLGSAIPASQIGFGGVDAATDHPLGVRVSTSTSVALSATAYNGASAGVAYTTIVNTAAAIPKTWASGDIFYVSFSYPVA
jgi:hypothetical protein